MDDPHSTVTAGRLLAVLTLVLLNGFFVAAEFALVAVRRSRIDQLVSEGRRSAKSVQNALQHLDSYLAATQLGITMASLGLGWIGEPALAGTLRPLFDGLPDLWAGFSAHAISVAAAFAIITSLHIVLGELAPKSLALQRTEGVALAVTRPLGWFAFLFRPVIFILNGAGNQLLKLLRLKPADGSEQVHSVEELKLLVGASRRAGLLGKEAEEIVERAFEFDEFAARQVMVPRLEIVAVPVQATPDQALAVALEQHHSRLPVFEVDLDHVLGFVHLADLVRAGRVRRDRDLRAVLQPVLMVPEMMPTDRLLTRMRGERAPLAILVDEYGGTSGLVTLHDLIERLVGPVLDVQEVTQDSIEPLPDGSLRIGGLALVHDIDDRFGLGVEDDEYDTIGGFVVSRLGRLPEVGDEVEVAGYRLRVESLDGRRIDRLRLTQLEPADEVPPNGHGKASPAPGSDEGEDEARSGRSSSAEHRISPLPGIAAARHSRG